MGITNNNHITIAMDSKLAKETNPFIRATDSIVIDTKEKPKDGDIVLVSYNGKESIKFIYETEQDPDSYMFTSLNPSKPPIVVNKNIINKVFKILSIIKM